MPLELEQECPECGETRTFWKSGTTDLHLGTKRKWQCSECGFSFVRIGGTVDTGVSA
jgi:rubredoxin